uniref:Uncharacterized protein n=1 Tax=Marmota marmota marmota TaxID=9994 RepID=A0A8C6A6R2_MARMA
SYGEHFFHVLLIDCISFSEKCLFRSLAHLLIGLFVFSIFYVLYIYLEISSLSDVQVVKMCSHSVGSLFTSLIISFAEKKLFSLNPSHLLILDFNSCAIGTIAYTNILKLESHLGLYSVNKLKIQ